MLCRRTLCGALWAGGIVPRVATGQGQNAGQLWLPAETEILLAAMTGGGTPAVVTGVRDKARPAYYRQLELHRGVGQGSPKEDLLAALGEVRSPLRGLAFDSEARLWEVRPRQPEPVRLTISQVSPGSAATPVALNWEWQPDSLLTSVAFASARSVLIGVRTREGSAVLSVQPEGGEIQSRRFPRPHGFYLFSTVVPQHIIGVSAELGAGPSMPVTSRLHVLNQKLQGDAEVTLSGWVRDIDYEPSRGVIRVLSAKALHEDTDIELTSWEFRGGAVKALAAGKPAVRGVAGSVRLAPARAGGLLLVDPADGSLKYAGPQEGPPLKTLSRLISEGEQLWRIHWLRQGGNWGMLQESLAVRRSEAQKVLTWTAPQRIQQWLGGI